MIDLSPNKAMITLNANYLKTSIKTHHLLQLIKKHYPNLCRLQETQFKYNEIDNLKIGGWKRIYYMNINQDKAGVAILYHIKQTAK